MFSTIDESDLGALLGCFGYLVCDVVDYFLKLAANHHLDHGVHLRRSLEVKVCGIVGAGLKADREGEWEQLGLVILEIDSRERQAVGNLSSQGNALVGACNPVLVEFDLVAALGWNELLEIPQVREGGENQSCRAFDVDYLASYLFCAHDGKGKLFLSPGVGLEPPVLKDIFLILGDIATRKGFVDQGFVVRKGVQLDIGILEFASSL